MIGKKLRVVRPGMFVTQEYDIDRVTMVVDGDDRIRSARIG